jgi:hypothetical protein
MYWWIKLLNFRRNLMAQPVTTVVGNVLADTQGLPLQALRHFRKCRGKKIQARHGLTRL